MALEKYNQKRDFSKTAEPKGVLTRRRTAAGPAFVVQEHHARNLHYDFRLEIEGVLKSWAVPKGPSLDPSVKRLAVLTEDHPMGYLDFEGSIPKGNYGAGEVAVWDIGTFEAEDDAQRQFEDGKLSFTLHGRKLAGAFSLIRTRRDNQWLLIKSRDEHAVPGWVLPPALADASPRGTALKKTAANSSPRGAATAKSAPKNSAAKTTTASPKFIDGAKRAPVPKSVKPMLATLVSRPPSGDWLYEIKWDGYRAVAFIENGKADLISRNGISLTAKFPELAEALAGLPVKNAVIDGEIVVLDDKGRPDFQKLQNRAGLYSKARRSSARSAEKDGPPAVALFYAFDLIHLDGFDLKGAALLDRKTLLQPLFTPSGFVRFSDHIAGAEAGIEAGPRLLEHARSLGLEGIVAKRADSTYVERRSEKWQKVKLARQIDVVIGGYTAPRRSRAHFGALVMGLYREGDLHYVGHTGSGFNAANLRETFELLQPLRTEKCPFARKPVTNEPAVWVKPQLVCEVKFTEWTGDGSLRHPIFVGLRADKDPRDCVFETPADNGPDAADTRPAEAVPAKAAAKARPVAGIPDAGEILARKNLKGNYRVQADGHVLELTNLDKVYWPDEGYTKGDLLRYYHRLADTILPYLRDRPLMLQRFPNGIAGKSFHQQNIDDPPPFLDTFVHTEDGAKTRYAVCNNLASLLYIANLGTIAQHAWLSRTAQPDKPDWIVFDLDPGDIGFDAVCALALQVRDVLKDLGIASYAKTSGSSGLHVCVPLQPLHTFDELERFTELVAQTATAARPDIATLERSLGKRPKNSIYLDAMQNREGKTVAAPWSLRAKPGATVSTPLTWAEIKRVPDPARSNIVTVPKRLKTRRDPFAEAVANPQNLTHVLSHLGTLAPARKSARRR